MLFTVLILIFKSWPSFCLTGFPGAHWPPGQHVMSSLRPIGIARTTFCHRLISSFPKLPRAPPCVLRCTGPHYNREEGGLGDAILMTQDNWWGLSCNCPPFAISEIQTPSHLGSPTAISSHLMLLPRARVETLILSYILKLDYSTHTKTWLLHSN